MANEIRREVRNYGYTELRIYGAVNRGSTDSRTHVTRDLRTTTAQKNNG